MKYPYTKTSTHHPFVFVILSGLSLLSQSYIPTEWLKKGCFHAVFDPDQISRTKIHSKNRLICGPPPHACALSLSSPTCQPDHAVF